MPHLTLIAALSDDGFISRGQGIAWHLPADIAHFRTATAGHWLLLGRRTYDEMHGWFSNHTPLVLTQHPSDLEPPGIAVASIAEALEKAAAQPALIVCGGGQVFAAAMPLATHLILTRVHTQLGSGIPFPAFEASEWLITSHQHHPADAQHAHAMDFIHLRKSA